MVFTIFQFVPSISLNFGQESASVFADECILCGK